MGLRHCTDVSAADWIAGSEAGWQRLVEFGPSGFAAYARLRFVPDPVRPGQGEADQTEEFLNAKPPDGVLLARLLRLLGEQTTTPEDCFVAFWDGMPHRNLPAAILDGPRFEVPHRRYLLFRGSLSEAVAGQVAGAPAAELYEPAFVWPADHAWCVANDVDPHWAGIGADDAAIERLLRVPGIDVVGADPAVRQPYYY